MQPHRPRLTSLPALLLAVGLGLVGYYGVEWYTLPEYSEADIEASVELNLQLDLQRRGPHLQPDAERLELLRKTIRAEVETEIRKEREKVQLRFGVGLIALVLGVGQIVGNRWAIPKN
ncbi:hypothetical protein SAMN04488120_1043 [Fontimonas thermophila]|uniref:Uncharacterized protein n=1 Tax=Fontimonas thermophila TaxID=1076937 RepID=A0A1I2IKQ1_9GAMM|nr:hypothetical protein [Fontimonas thermophila]SFF42213.1 hypothetical protein SAMN04488120_1043 [Fontimonas thermophila]